jgi:hypothetical protein
MAQTSEKVDQPFHCSASVSSLYFRQVDSERSSDLMEGMTTFLERCDIGNCGLGDRG